MAIDPLTLAMGASAGADILGSIFGGAAQSEARDQNLEIAMRNLEEQRRAREEMLGFARDIRREEQLGSSDAFGNRTYFDPNVGWVTELSPASEQLRDLAIGQAVYQGTTGEDIRRADLERGGAAREAEGVTADALMDEFRHLRRPSRPQLANQLYAAGEIGRQDNVRDIVEGAARISARQGNTSNMPQVFAEVAREGSRASEDARRQAELGSYDLERTAFTQPRADVGNLYGFFRGRSTSGNVQPTSVPTGVDVRAPTPNVQQGNQALMAASGREVLQPYVTPDYGLANTLTSAGGTVGSSLMNMMLLDRLGGEAGKTNAASRRLSNVFS